MTSRRTAQKASLEACPGRVIGLFFRSFFSCF
jgi:hypothetical protein